MANGDTSIPRGKADFQLEVNGTELWHSMIVADLAVPLILGYDFMYDHDCSLDVRKGHLKIGKNHIQCNAEGQRNFVFRIKLENDFTVPPGSEMIVNGSIDDESYCLAGISEAILEAKTDSSLAKQGIMVAKALVNPSHGKVPLRLMNLTAEPQSLRQSTVAATIESVESVTAIENAQCPNDPLFVRSLHDLDPKDLPEHLQQVWETNSPSLDDNQKQCFLQLLLKHQEVFAKSKHDLGRTDLVQHDIDTGDHRPIKQAPRCIPLNKRAVAEQEVQLMLENGIIEPSISAWSSQIVLVEKKDHSMRFCVDYRALNEVTKKDSYPLPRIDDCFDALTGTHWFSSIDLQSGYWQVGLSPSAMEKTAFSCPSGLFQFKVLPFGVCNGPPMFQRLMEHVLAGLQWKICLLYLDDFFVTSLTVSHTGFTEHLIIKGECGDCRFPVFGAMYGGLYWTNNGE